MQDEDKSKEQLIVELHALRKRVAELGQDKSASTDPAELSCRAEEWAKAGQTETDLRETDDSERLGPELAVHQVELEMQDEELRNALAKIGESGTRYSDLTSVSDITERKMAENALKELEERYRVLFEGSIHGILAVDIETKRFLFANPSICHMLGYTENELMDLSIEDIHPKDSLNLVLSEFESQLLRKKKLSSTLPCLRKDGTVFFADIASNLTSINGRELAVGFFSDVTERQMAHEQIESIARFPDENPNPILRISGDGKLLYANRSSSAFLKSLGWKQGETLPGDCRQHVLRTLSSGCMEEMELTCERVVYSLMLVPVSDLGYLNIYGLDITGRKQVEDALLESENKFKSFAEHALAGIYIIQEGVFKYVNPRFAQMFGYTVEECLDYMPFKKLVYAEDLDTVEEQVGRRISGVAESAHYTFRGLKKNGQIFHVEIYGSVIVYQGKQAATGTILDITERVQAEEAIRQQVNFQQTLIDTIPSPIFYKDTEGRYLGCNSSFESYIGLNKADIITKTVYDVAPRDLADIYREADLAMFREPGVQQYETCVQYADGTRHDVLFTKGAFSDLDGKTAGLVGVMLDITDRKRAERELSEYRDHLEDSVKERTTELAIANEQLTREIEERERTEEALKQAAEKLKFFAYSVAHDLKSPAIGIYGLTRRLSKHARDVLDEKGMTYCDQILKASEHIAALVEKINIYIATKEAAPLIEAINIADILRMLKDEFYAQLSLRRIDWLTPESEVKIEADRLSILRIFRNLIDNALKYGGESLTRISIGYKGSESFHIFSVTDDGKGLKEADAEKIFALFQRDKTSRGVEGAGLGLAIVREIAEQHGGRVWVEPRGKKGITFYVSISKNL
ncbi:putative PAS/PAC sensor signal transduction histidine kinase [Syntrophobacter sp. SbD1]|nr:putative PAS/PAC sensor signal transduction histidine kinase [Syntrophobacter sp. SbD1]